MLVYMFIIIEVVSVFTIVCGIEWGKTAMIIWGILGLIVGLPFGKKAAEKQEREQQEKQRLEGERREREQLKKEQLEKDRLEKQQRAQEQLQEQLKKLQQEMERSKQEKIEREQQAKEAEEKQRQEAERVEQEKREQEQRAKEEDERRQRETSRQDEERRRERRERRRLMIALIKILFWEKERRIGMSEIDQMDGHRFEYYCAGLLQRLGFSDIEVTKGSGDQGVDIVAVKDSIRYAIQCKRYSSLLGNSPVQEVNAGKQLYHCHVAVVLTNRYFTSGAKTLASATGVLLWDRDKLEAMIKQAETLAQ